MTIKLLAFDGSSRKGSVNHQLLKQVVAQVEAQGASVTTIDLGEYNLPLYNGDVEAAGLPEGVTALKNLFKEHDGFLIATPEYNGSFSPLLKNAIDWVSRPVEGEAYLNCFKDKVAGLMAASPGKLGGMRGLAQLNTVLFGIGVLVLPDMVSVAFYNDAFDADGGLKHDADKAAAANLAKRITRVSALYK